jgi:hypothetical protein
MSRLLATVNAQDHPPQKYSNYRINLVPFRSPGFRRVPQKQHNEKIKVPRAFSDFVSTHFSEVQVCPG